MDKQLLLFETILIVVGILFFPPKNHRWRSHAVFV